MFENSDILSKFRSAAFTKLVDKEITKDGSSFICSYVASAVKMLGGDRIKVYGFSSGENPSAKYFEDEDEEEGHHFAVLDNRYIIDPWIHDNFAEDGKPFNKSVFDMNDDKDKELISYIYGDKKSWTDITSKTDDFKELFPKSVDALQNFMK